MGVFNGVSIAYCFLWLMDPIIKSQFNSGV